MPLTGENFIAIGKGKKTLLRQLKNIGMASEKMYRKTLRANPHKNQTKSNFFGKA